MDSQIFEEKSKVDEKKESFEEETKVEEKKESFEEETKVEEKKESLEEETKGEEYKEEFELNKKNLPIFKLALRQAEEWIVQEKVRAKGLRKEHREAKSIWKPRAQKCEEGLKKIKAELNEARIDQEELLAKAYSILIKQGRISERPSNTTIEQEREGQEFKASEHRLQLIDKATSDLIFQLIS